MDLDPAIAPLGTGPLPSVGQVVLYISAYIKASGRGISIEFSQTCVWWIHRPISRPTNDFLRRVFSPPKLAEPGSRNFNV